MSQRPVVFVHAHPDDEAIFTGGTIRRLTTSGHPVTVIIATDGSCGTEESAGDHGRGLADRRAAEARLALSLLGCEDVISLGFRDSGMSGAPDNDHPQAFVGAERDTVADRIAAVCRSRAAPVLVGYDAGGMYGHPDHRMVHDVTRRAWRRMTGATLYEATVDREYLHFVDTHLVELAALGGPMPYEEMVGSVTAEIPTAVDVRRAAADKREAMLAHQTQVDPALLPVGEAFTAVYGWEWYLRAGPSDVLDELARATTDAHAGAAPP